MIFKKILKSEKNTNNKYEMKVKSYAFLEKGADLLQQELHSPQVFLGYFWWTFLKQQSGAATGRVP